MTRCPNYDVFMECREECWKKYWPEIDKVVRCRRKCRKKYLGV